MTNKIETIAFLTVLYYANKISKNLCKSLEYMKIYKSPPTGM